MFIKYDNLGKITEVLYVSKQFEEYYKEYTWFDDDIDVSINNSYIENNTIYTIPDKPEINFTFNYNTKQWEFDSVSADISAKQQRDKLLAEGPDRISPMWWSSMTPEEQQAWSDYRQALLDITTQPNYPETIVWPTKP